MHDIVMSSSHLISLVIFSGSGGRLSKVVPETVNYKIYNEDLGDTDVAALSSYFTLPYIEASHLVH